MRGTMLWFNAEKDLGLIETDGGERIPVAGVAFAAGAKPTGERCGGTVVEFRIADGPDRQAVGVTRVAAADPRRARRRRSHAG